MCSYAILFLLLCGAKLQNYGLVLACFSLSCSPGAISLNRVAFHMESEKHAVSFKASWKDLINAHCNGYGGRECSKTFQLHKHNS